MIILLKLTCEGFKKKYQSLVKRAWRKINYHTMYIWFKKNKRDKCLLIYRNKPCICVDVETRDISERHDKKTHAQLHINSVNQHAVIQTVTISVSHTGANMGFVKKPNATQSWKSNTKQQRVFDCGSMHNLVIYLTS